MTRDDLSFLIEKAIGLWLLVIGLDWLPELVDRWIGGIGVEDTSSRLLALRTLVPLAAGAFLLLRRSGPATGAAVAPSTHLAMQASMRATDWLWVGSKLLGAYAMLTGAGQLVMSGAWATVAEVPGGASLGGLLHSAVWSIGGAFLFFGNGLWRAVSRTAPATA